MSEKTPEQLAAEKAAADAKAAAKQAADKAKTEAKAKAAEQKAAKKAAAEQAKADAKAKREQEAADKKAKAEAEKKAKADAREAAKQAKIKAKEDAKAAKLAAKQPEQNGVRRPGPNGKCGAAWALMDSLSAKLGAPVAIADLLAASREKGMNDNMVRSNYAAWRKFNGVSGRVLSQADVAKAKAQPTAGASA